MECFTFLWVHVDAANWKPITIFYCFDTEHKLCVHFHETNFNVESYIMSINYYEKIVNNNPCSTKLSI